MKIAFHTLGCKVNQYETEAIKEAFVSRGAEIVADDEFADAYIINTCTVTNIADRKSRQFIRRMKSINPDAVVVVTGCYAQVKPEEIKAMDEVDIVIGNNYKSQICDIVIDRISYADTDCLTCGDNKYSMVSPTSQLTSYEDMGITTAAESGKTRAYIKIQDGCDRYCSYCLIPYARGRVRSRSVNDVLAEAESLITKGYKEIVLTGINTAMYGRERDFALDLSDDTDAQPLELLISKINDIPGDFRIRLSSLEPTVVDSDDVERIIKYDKLCKHLHLSVQSGSDNVLKRMNRRYTRTEYMDIVSAIRKHYPLYGITTDIIVGFPGETESDFNYSLDIVKKSEFIKVHAFRYSPRTGTKAAEMQDKVDGVTSHERAEKLEKLSETVSAEFRKKNTGICHRVLTEQEEGDYITGYTGNYIKVYLEKTPTTPIGEFVDVIITEIYRDGCKGRIVGNS